MATIRKRRRWSCRQSVRRGKKFSPDNLTLIALTVPVTVEALTGLSQSPWGWPTIAITVVLILRAFRDSLSREHVEGLGWGLFIGCVILPFTLRALVAIVSGPVLIQA